VVDKRAHHPNGCAGEPQPRRGRDANPRIRGDTLSSLLDELHQRFFLRHVVYFYRFCSKYISVPFFSLTCSAITLQQAAFLLEEPQGSWALHYCAVPDAWIPDDPSGSTFFTVAKLDQERALVLFSTTHMTGLVPRSLRTDPKLGFYGDFSWVFVLEEVDESSTRLILRSRAQGGPRLFMLLNNLLLPPAGFVIVRLMLRTIKQRVEGTTPH
jgi:hypothetical protein